MFKNKNGSIVVLDVHNGEILALESSPNFSIYSGMVISWTYWNKNLSAASSSSISAGNCSLLISPISANENKVDLLFSFWDSCVI